MCGRADAGETVCGETRNGNHTERDVDSVKQKKRHGLATARLDEISNLGDIHGILKQCGTISGRLSASLPPRGGGAFSVIVEPVPGRTFLFPHCNWMGLYRADQGRSGLNDGVTCR